MTFQSPNRAENRTQMPWFSAISFKLLILNKWKCSNTTGKGIKGKQQQGKRGIPPGTDEAENMAAVRLVQARLGSTALESSYSLALTGGKKPFHLLSLRLRSSLSSAESMSVVLPGDIRASSESRPAAYLTACEPTRWQGWQSSFWSRWQVTEVALGQVKQLIMTDP